MAGTGPDGQSVVLWDEDCGFCAWTLGLVLRLDRRRRLRPSPIQGPEGARLLADLDEAQRLASWHMVDETGTRRSAGAAVTSALRRLPGGRVPALVTGSLPRATEWAYAWVATHRSALSRPVPTVWKARARARIASRA